MNSSVTTALIAAGFGLVGGLIGGALDYVVREREINVKMVEIAVGLLREDPKGRLQPAREWAVQVIDDNSDTPLSDAARQALLNCPVDKFAAIGRSATGKELPGATLNLPTVEDPCLRPVQK
jgi:hypothetical protein